MKAKISSIVNDIACLILLACTLWISCCFNLVEIIGRTNGRDTFYSWGQRIGTCAIVADEYCSSTTAQMRGRSLLIFFECLFENRIA
jgi:hypothetical protein